jgi:hypothetical protein
VKRLMAEDIPTLGPGAADIIDAFRRLARLSDGMSEQQLALLEAQRRGALAKILRWRVTLETFARFLPEGPGKTLCEQQLGVLLLLEHDLVEEIRPEQTAAN